MASNNANEIDTNEGQPNKRYAELGLKQTFNSKYSENIHVLSEDAGQGTNFSAKKTSFEGSMTSTGLKTHHPSEIKKGTANDYRLNTR